MAAKGKTTAKSGSGQSKITRIKATDAKKDTVAAPAKKARADKAQTPAKKRSLKGVKAFIGYFTGAWYELKQVRWPTRRATWGMTAALLLFTTFFIVVILLLDALFKYLFQIIIG